ncbi:protein FAM169B-like [Pseudophryne corroboree]|uniref:protein FAM169B-like n=1 Tax=Pseudophryne corroboree TaxID=495146 RepID=UPI00308198D6
MTEKLTGLCCPVASFKSSDFQGWMALSAQHYLHITQQSGPSNEFFSCPDGEKASLWNIKVDATCVLCVPLFCDEDSQKMLLLVNPKKKDMVLAVYLDGKWWGVDDILQTCVPVQEGLKQVQTFGERIVLFILNCLVCGFVQGGASENGVCFLPHTAGELAKILWHHGEALAFYTYKKKGGLCNRSQCYMLPVLDTIYVRQKWRRQGFGITMLQDFCLTFSQEAALGISSPISPKMYQVCGRFLADNPKERDRLWEVDPPGDWNQRTNIWLRIQLGETPVESPVEKSPECTETEISVVEAQMKHHPDDGVSVSAVSSVTQPLSRKRRSDGGQVVQKQKRRRGKKMRKRQMEKVYDPQQSEATEMLMLAIEAERKRVTH